MTEEIIVNDVNVAGCAYFRESRCFDCGTQAICCQHPNCYYKQFKRLEQENKELKAIIYKLESKTDAMCEHNQELWKENEALLKQKNGVVATNIKYFMALEKIREITSPHCSQCVEIIDKINEVLGNECRE